MVHKDKMGNQVGMMLGERKVRQNGGKKTPSGFDAYGYRVPESRLSRGLKEVRRMAPSLTTMEATGLIGKVADGIERDEPYEALGAARDVLDLTGSYVLIATLLTDGA